MEKRFLIIVSAVILGGVLAGCSSSENSRGSESKESISSTLPMSVADSTSTPVSSALSNAGESSFVAESSSLSSIASSDISQASSSSSVASKIKEASKLLFNGELITEIAKRDLVQNNDYILDVAYVIDESRPEIQIAIQVPIGTDIDTVKKAGDKAARYLASLANFANSDFELPGNEDLGGLFEKYNLLLYIDDGYGNIDQYGAKVNFSPVITW